jgi:hypothetical protein
MDWAQVNVLVLLRYGLWDTCEYGEVLWVTGRDLKMSRKVRHLGATLMLTILLPY